MALMKLWSSQSGPMVLAKCSHGLLVGCQEASGRLPGGSGAPSVLPVCSQCAPKVPLKTFKKPLFFSMFSVC